MFKILIVFFTVSFFLSSSIADDKRDCSKISKLSKEYYVCKKQSISNSSKAYTLKSDFSKFSEKKTLADFFKKD